jgi:hypothetical protein
MTGADTLKTRAGVLELLAFTSTKVHILLWYSSSVQRAEALDLLALLVQRYTYCCQKYKT